MEAPTCKGPIFPAGTAYGAKESKSHEEHDVRAEMELTCTPPANASEVSPDSGKVAGAVVNAGLDEDNRVFKSWSKLDASSNENEVVVGEMVNLPKKDLKTNLLSERGLEACHNEESHGVLAVANSMQPKIDTILQLASLTSPDLLDTAAAQPLLAGGPPERDHLAVVLRENPPPPTPIPMPTPLATFIPSLEEFPPLGKGRTLKIRDSFEMGAVQRGKDSVWPRRLEGAQEPMDSTAMPNPLVKTPLIGEGVSPGPVVFNLDGGVNGLPRITGIPTNKGDPNGQPTNMVNDGIPSVSKARTNMSANNSNGAGGAAEVEGDAGKPRTMADVIQERPDPNGPQVFVPEKIQNIGYASLSNGIPSIYFSGAEIQKLADNVGYAIVGKFSHSIPASFQIQKALDNIKFGRSFSWKYINAKHILVQFEDIADYARMLGGPKGTPVWYIDRHPMRVFKWTPDFDAYCESPIAAIWCNLIGLPIHLFDQSALFTIGKLLGTPIQVDRATADKTRLSFARICVEIDITKPPPEEIILDICGRETVQQVKWGKIPSYCRECKHVGHSSEVCYAAGKMERPEKRNYNIPKQKHHGEQNGKAKQDQPHRIPKENDLGQEKIKDAHVGSKGKETKEPAWMGPDIMGESSNAYGGDPGSKEEEETETRVRNWDPLGAWT